MSFRLKLILLTRDVGPVCFHRLTISDRHVSKQDNQCTVGYPLKLTESKRYNAISASLLATYLPLSIPGTQIIYEDSNDITYENACVDVH